MLYFNSAEERKAYYKEREYKRKKKNIYKDIDKVVGMETNRTERNAWNCRIPFAYGETRIKRYR